MTFRRSFWRARFEIRDRNGKRLAVLVRFPVRGGLAKAVLGVVVAITVDLGLWLRRAPKQAHGAAEMPEVGNTVVAGT
jgi:hypothetical protein